VSPCLNYTHSILNVSESFPLPPVLVVYPLGCNSNQKVARRAQERGVDVLVVVATSGELGADVDLVFGVVDDWPASVTDMLSTSDLGVNVILQSTAYFCAFRVVVAGVALCCVLFASLPWYRLIEIGDRSFSVADM
jgi:hypothetical protein